MRRTYYIVLSALAVFALLPSCQEKLEEPNNGNAPFKMSVSALLSAHEEVLEESDGTRALSSKTESDGKRWIMATWKAGDKVYVYKVSQDATSASDMFKKVGVLTATKNGVPFQDMVGDEGGSPGRRPGNIYQETDLAGEIDADLVLGPNDGLLFSYKHELGFSYSGQAGTLEDIDANYDYAVCFTYAKVHHDSQTIEIPGKLTFWSQQAIVRFELINEAGDPLVPSSLTLEASPYGSWRNGLMPFWGADDMYEAYHHNYVNSDTDNSANVGPIVVSPSSNIVYVALRGNDFYKPSYGIGYTLEHSGSLHSCQFDLTATVGNETYYYHRSHWYVDPNNYAEVRVRMKKKTTSD